MVLWEWTILRGGIWTNENPLPNFLTMLQIPNNDQVFSDTNEGLHEPLRIDSFTIATQKGGLREPVTMRIIYNIQSHNSVWKTAYRRPYSKLTPNPICRAPQSYAKGYRSQRSRTTSEFTQPRLWIRKWDASSMSLSLPKRIQQTKKKSPTNEIQQRSNN